MNSSQKIQDIIVLGAGASKSEAPHLGLLQNELLRDYFVKMTERVRIGEPNSEADVRDYNRYFRLCKFMKSIFDINMGSCIKKDDYETKIREISFPAFEEILGLIDTSLNQQTYFKGYGSLYSVGDYDLQNVNGDQVTSRYRDYISSEERNNHEESMVQIRNDFVFAICDVLTRNLETPYGHHINLVGNLFKERIPQTAFLSLNYDILIDNAFVHGSKFNLRSDYGFEYQGVTGTPVGLFKLHGSLNWVYCPRCVQIHYAGTDKLASKLANEYVTCPNCDQELVPILVPPTFVKDITNPYLRQVWLTAELKLRNAKRIIFCGYSFPDADLQIRYLLKRIQINQTDSRNNFKVDVVNGKRRDGETERDWIKRKRWEKMRFETFFGKNIVTYHELDFEMFAKNPI